MAEHTEGSNSMIVTDVDGTPIGIETGDTDLDNDFNKWMADCKQRAKEKYESSEICEKIRLSKENSKKAAERFQEKKAKRDEFWEKTMKELDEEDEKLNKNIMCTIS